MLHTITGLLAILFLSMAAALRNRSQVFQALEEIYIARSPMP